MMNLFVPLSVTASDGVVQLAVFRSVFCCNPKFVEGNGQETITVFVLVSEIVSDGAPGVCTVENDQKPPVREKLPPLITGPASGWPMVPLTE